MDGKTDDLKGREGSRRRPDRQRRLKREGKTDQASGKVKEKLDDATDWVEDKVDDVKDKLKRD